MTSYDVFAKNCELIQQRLDQACRACGRSPEAVRILPVTKNHPKDAINFSARYGFQAIGENRIQEAVSKKEVSEAHIQWECIGHVQSNKAKLAVAHFDRIQSIDSIKLIKRIDRLAAEANKRQRILLEVNTGEDSKKFGVMYDDAAPLLECALTAQHVSVEGLMTIAPLAEDKEVAKTAFMRLRELRDSLQERFNINLPELSMGMSGDFVEAIEAGSTLIRIGTALFGERPTSN